MNYDFCWQLGFLSLRTSVVWLYAFLSCVYIWQEISHEVKHICNLYNSAFYHPASFALHLYFRNNFNDHSNQYYININIIVIELPYIFSSVYTICLMKQNIKACHVSMFMFTHSFIALKIRSCSKVSWYLYKNKFI